MGGEKVLIVFSHSSVVHTLCESMRLDTRSRSPWTGWSSASWGSTRYNQSTRAWRASANCPENSRASSSLCCLERRRHTDVSDHLPHVTSVMNSWKSQFHWQSFILFTSLHSCHRQCPTCRGPLLPGGPVSGCLRAAELCPSWPFQILLLCRKPAASTPVLSGTPVHVEKEKDLYMRTLKYWPDGLFCTFAVKKWA